MASRPRTTPVLPETDPQQATASKREVSARALVVLAVVAVLAYVADRISKILVVDNLALGQPVDIIGELLQFRYVENPGAAFSLGSGSTWIFAIIAAVVAVFIVFFARRIRSTGWAVLFGLLLGGNLGNLTDRLHSSTRASESGTSSTSFRSTRFPRSSMLPISAIVSSMGLFILLTVRGIGLDGTRTYPSQRANPTFRTRLRPRATSHRRTGSDRGNASLPVPDGLAGERVDSAIAKLLGFSRTFAAEVAELGRSATRRPSARQVGPTGLRRLARGLLAVKGRARDHPDRRAPTSGSSTTTTTSS